MGIETLAALCGHFHFLADAGQLDGLTRVETELSVDEVDDLLDRIHDRGEYGVIATRNGPRVVGPEFCLRIMSAPEVRRAAADAAVNSKG